MSSSLECSSHCSDCTERGNWDQSLRKDSAASFPCSFGVRGSSESDGRYGGGGDDLTWEDVRRDLAGGRGRGVMEPASIQFSTCMYGGEDPCNVAGMLAIRVSYSCLTKQNGGKRTATG